MKVILVFLLMAILAGMVVGCSTPPVQKKRVVTPANNYDDLGVRQNVRRALDDADAQLPARPR